MLETFNKMTVPPIIIYTKLENHLMDVGNKLKERDDFDDLSVPEKEKLKVARANEVIQHFTADILDHLE